MPRSGGVLLYTFSHVSIHASCAFPKVCLCPVSLSLRQEVSFEASFSWCMPLRLQVEFSDQEYNCELKDLALPMETDCKVCCFPRSPRSILLYRLSLCEALSIVLSHTLSRRLDRMIVTMTVCFCCPTSGACSAFRTLRKHRAICSVLPWRWVCCSSL